MRALRLLLCGPFLLAGLATAPAATAADDEALPTPAVFGIRPGDGSTATRGRLRAAGYVSRAMTNSGGCVVEHFEHTAEDAPMPRADIWLCGPERRVARLDIEGQAGEHFYKAVKERFRLGVRQREGDPVGPRYGNYARDFADGLRLTMTNTRGTARLRLEDPQALRRADALRQNDVRRLEETAAARERARQEQQDNHF